MGEHDLGSIVWDNIAVFPAGATWEDRPPPPLYEGGPVVHVLDEARQAVVRAVNGDNIDEAGAK